MKCKNCKVEIDEDKDYCDGCQREIDINEQVMREYEQAK